VVDWKFVAVAVAAAGAITLDVEASQWDLRHRGNLYEANFLTGRTRAQGYGYNFSVLLFQLWAMHARKKAVMLNEQAGIAKSKGFIGVIPWYLPGAAMTAVHLGGAAQAFAAR
jgi:hypothetical protein